VTIGKEKTSFLIFLYANEEETLRFSFSLSASPLPIFHKSDFQQRVVP